MCFPGEEVGGDPLFVVIFEKSQHVRADIVDSLPAFGQPTSFAAKAGTLAGGGSDEEIERSGKTAAEIGEAFQILDDVQNLTTGNPSLDRKSVV